MYLKGNIIIHIESLEEVIIRADLPPRRVDGTRRQWHRFRLATRHHNIVRWRLATTVGVRCTAMGCIMMSMLWRRQIQTAETRIVAPAELHSPVDHNKIAEYVSEQRRARDLMWHLPKRILHLHFAQ